MTPTHSAVDSSESIPSTVSSVESMVTKLRRLIFCCCPFTSSKRHREKKHAPMEIGYPTNFQKCNPVLTEEERKIVREMSGLDLTLLYPHATDTSTTVATTTTATNNKMGAAASGTTSGSTTPTPSVPPSPVFKPTPLPVLPPIPSITSPASSPTSGANNRLHSLLTQTRRLSSSMSMSFLGAGGTGGTTPAHKRASSLLGGSAHTTGGESTVMLSVEMEGLEADKQRDDGEGFEEQGVRGGRGASV